MIRPFLLTALVVFSGCLADDSPKVPLETTPPEPIGPVLATIRLGNCTEIQAELTANPDDFEGGLPAGFDLVLDQLGLARIVVLARSCQENDVTSDSLISVVLVAPPDSMARSEADHGILLSLWSESANLLNALAAMNITIAEERSLQTETTAALMIHESRTSSDPDFLMTIQSAGQPAQAQYCALRIFSLANQTVNAAFDSMREDRTSWEGAATASFVISPTVGDLPYHSAGTGRILEGEPFAASYEQVSLDVIPDGVSASRAQMRS